MKKAFCLTVAVLLSAVSPTGATADTPSAQNQTPSDTDNLALQDPDGVPLVISHPKPVTRTQEQIDAERKSNEASANWLLRSYEQQLQNRTHATGTDDSNMFHRISSDKDLARLAGLSSVAPTLPDESASLKLGVNDSSQSAMNLRSDSSSPAPAKKLPDSLAGPAIKPLITPLGAADAAGLHNFYSSLPAVSESILPPVSNPSPSTDTDSNHSPVDYDIPGKVAAGNNPVLDLDKNTLTLDPLPDENLPSNDSHHSSDASSPTLPPSTNAAQLQKLTDTALNAPGTTKTTQLQSVNVSSLQLNIKSEDGPIKLIPPSPVRQPIASPFSILDH